MPTGMNLINEQTRTLWSVPVTMSEPEQPSKRTVRIKRRYISDALKAQPTKSRFIFTQTVSLAARSAPCLRTRDPRAPPTYPFLAYATVKDRSRLWSRYNGSTVDLLRVLRQPRRRSRSLAQPLRGGKRQIRPPSQRERDVVPSARMVKGSFAGLFVEAVPRLEPRHEARNSLLQRRPRRKPGQRRDGVDRSKRLGHIRRRPRRLPDNGLPP